MKYINAMLLIVVLLFLSGCDAGEEERRLTDLYQNISDKNKALQKKLQQSENFVEQLNSKMIDQDITITEHRLLLIKYAATQAKLKQITADTAQQAEKMDTINKKNKALEKENLSLKEELMLSSTQLSNIKEKLATEELKMISVLQSVAQKEDEYKNLITQLENRDINSNKLQQQKTINNITEQLSSKEAQVNAPMDSYEKQKTAVSGQ